MKTPSSYCAILGWRLGFLCGLLAFGSIELFLQDRWIVAIVYALIAVFLYWVSKGVPRYVEKELFDE